MLLHLQHRDKFDRGSCYAPKRLAAAGMIVLYGVEIHQYSEQKQSHNPVRCPLNAFLQHIRVIIPVPCQACS